MCGVNINDDAALLDLCQPQRASEERGALGFDGNADDDKSNAVSQSFQSRQII